MYQMMATMKWFSFSTAVPINCHKMEINDR